MQLIQQTNTKDEFKFFVFKNLTKETVLKKMQEAYELSSNLNNLPTMGDLMDSAFQLYGEALIDYTQHHLLYNVEHVLGYSELDKTIEPIPIKEGDLQLALSMALENKGEELRSWFFEDVRKIVMEHLQLFIIDSNLPSYCFIETKKIINIPTVEVW